YTDLVVQAMVPIHEMQRRAVVLRKTNTVLDGNDIIRPTVNDGRRTIEDALPQLGQSCHIQRGSHQKHPSGMQKRRRCYCNVTAHARADQHQVARQLLAEVHELCDTGSWLLDAAIVHRMRFVALAASYFGQRRNLPPPRATFLAMGEDYVAIDYGRFHNNSSRLIEASLTTRPPVSSPPSARSRFR